MTGWGQKTLGGAGAIRGLGQGAFEKWEGPEDNGASSGQKAKVWGGGGFIQSHPAMCVPPQEVRGQWMWF